MSNRIHVVPYGNKWAYRRENSERVSGVCQTQAEAIDAARHIAILCHGQVIIHGTDGAIRAEMTYGHDPCPPHDRT